MSIYIKRIHKNNKFYYFNQNNKKITNKKILNEINKIYIAPAYTNVKIYLNSNILATGIDKAGRKQYIYSENMKKKRDIKKYKNLLKISKHIDKLKRKINKDLEQTKFNKNKLIALVLKIMDLCNFRSGNKLYEKKYGSYGITTIHKKHVLLKKDYIEIDFVGKKGVNNNCIIKNKIIQNIIKDVYNLSVDKKSYLFSIIYNKNPIQITVLDVNNYLKIFDITTKDLRTWNANVIFLKNLMKIVKNINETYYKKNNIKQLKLRKKMIKEAIQNTAISLHHTPSICKSSYIYKLIIEKLLNNSNIFDNIKKYNEPEDLLRYFL